MSNHYPTVQDREGNQAIDENIKAASNHGFSVAHGCEVNVESGNLGAPDTIFVSDGALLVNGEHFTIKGEPTFRLRPAENFPRWDVVYVDETGTIQIEEGEEEPREPQKAERTAVKRPAPPDMSETVGTVLAICWIRAGSNFLGSDDIITRRSEGDHMLHRTQATGLLQKQTLPQGETLHVPEDHVMQVTPPYNLDGTLELDGTLDLR